MPTFFCLSDEKIKSALSSTTFKHCWVVKCSGKVCALYSHTDLHRGNGAAMVKHGKQSTVVGSSE